MQIEHIAAVYKASAIETGHAGGQSGTTSVWLL